MNKKMTKAEKLYMVVRMWKGRFGNDREVRERERGEKMERENKIKSRQVYFWI